jgi:monoamine oxidase
MNIDTDLCIIGAGLSGLALAVKLQAEGRDVMVLESRDRTGGRVLSQDGYDLGPSWIWPHNHRMLALLERLSLNTFAQYASGRLVFEDATGRVRRDLEFATMGGALRIEGGLARVTDALAAGLGDRLRLSCRVHRVLEEPGGVSILMAEGHVRAAQVILAMPPRLVAGLGVAVPDAPTWMAGQAKLVATYPAAFWRENGLNGDAISHRGPLAEIHDASPAGARVGALFGFAQVGAARKPGFQGAAIAQLVRLFGQDAAMPDDVFIKDWSVDPATAIKADLTPPSHHPDYSAVPPTRRVIFAGTEMSPDHGGFLEGALTAAEAAHAALGLVTD